MGDKDIIHTIRDIRLQDEAYEKRYTRQATSSMPHPQSLINIHFQQIQELLLSSTSKLETSISKCINSVVES